MKFLWSCLNFYFHKVENDSSFTQLNLRGMWLPYQDSRTIGTVGGQRKQIRNTAPLPDCGKQCFMNFGLTAGFRKYVIYIFVLVMCHRLIYVAHCIFTQLKLSETH